MRSQSSLFAHPCLSWAVGFCALGVVACAGSARATTLDVTYVAAPLWANGVNVYYAGTSYNNIIAGQIALTATVVGGSGSSFTVNAWCVDLFHEIYLGQNHYTYAVSGAVVSDDSNGHALSSAVSSQLLTLAAYGNALLAGAKAGDSDFSSAVQLAIWQTEYNGLTFTASDNVVAVVRSLKNYAAQHSAIASSILALSGGQNLITDSVSQGFQNNNSLQTSVPEPASIALIGVGMLALGASRRRKVK
jgi:hypothetical protein